MFVVHDSKDLTVTVTEVAPTIDINKLIPYALAGALIGLAGTVIVVAAERKRR